MADNLSFLLTVRDMSKRGLDSFAKGLDKASQKGRSAGRAISDGMTKAAEGANVMAAAAAGIGPAIVPIAAAAVPAVAGLGAAFAGAGAAGMVFSKVMGTTFAEVQETADAHDELREKVKAYGEEAKLAAARGDDDAAKAALENQKVATQELIAAQKALDPALGRVASSYRGMKFAAEEFVDANKPATYGLMEMAFGMVQEHLGKFQPLFDVASRAAGQFLIAVQGWARGGGLKSMVDFLAGQASATFPKVQQLLANLAAGFGPLFTASAGQGQGILQWFVDMSARLATFAQGGGWQRFVDYTAQNGPQVMAVLSNIGTSLLTLVQAVTPLAPVSLAVAAALTQIIAAVPPEVLTAVVGGFVAYNVAMKAWTVGALAASAATKGWAVAQRVLNVAMRMNPIGLIVTGLVLLGVALVTAYKKSETFRRIVNAGFAAVKSVAATVFRFIGNVAKQVFGAITAYVRFQINVWRAIIGGVRAFAVNAWRTIQSVGKATWSGLTSAVRTAVTTARNLIGTMQDKARSVLDRIKNMFSPSTLKDAGRRLIQGLIDGIQSMIHKPVELVEGALGRLKGLLPGSPIKWGPLKGWNRGGAGKRLMGLLTTGVQQGTPAYVKAMRTALEAKTGIAKSMAHPGSTSAGVTTAARRNVLASRISATTAAARDAAAALRPGSTSTRRSSSALAGGDGLTINLYFQGQALVTERDIFTTVVRAANSAKAQGFNIPRGTFGTG